MNSYLVTVTFLMMMSLLTSSEMIKFSQSTVESICYQESRSALAIAENLREHSHLEEFRHDHAETFKGEEEEEENDEKTAPIRNTTSPRRSTPLGFNSYRPPNNSRLNLYVLLHREPHKKLPADYSLYEVTARMMRRLYQNAPFFQKIPNAEYRILDKLFEKKEEASEITFPEELSQIDLDDPALQEVFYTMLKGTQKRPSLLNYITFDKNESVRDQSRKINLMFASPLIIEEIFQDETVSKQVLDCRDKIWEEILDQENHRLERTKEECKSRTVFKEELLKEFEQICLRNNLNFEAYKTHVFDFTLGHAGTILFIEDPLTGELLREKYTPPKRVLTK